MSTRGETTDNRGAEGANISESLRQKASCRTHLWRVPNPFRPPKKQAVV